MIEAIQQIKRQFRDIYKFVPSGGTEEDPTFADGVVKDGQYYMNIQNKHVLIIVKDNKIWVTLL